MSPLLPTVASYLDHLPEGEASYPDCTVKASLLRNALGARPLGPEVPLPPTVRALVAHPPPVSVWIPEVHFNAVSIAIRDVHFGGPTLDAYLAWVYDQNRRLFTTALYRALFFVLSPERLLVGMEKRWGSFRRGTEASVVERSSSAVEIRVTAPPFLYTETTVRGMAAALQSAIDCAGARRSHVEGAQLSPTEVAYRGRWG